MAKPPVTSLADQVTRGLSAQGLTLAAAARHLGVQRPTLQSWLRENRYPRDIVPRLAALAHLPATTEEALAEGYAFETSKWTWAGKGRPRIAEDLAADPRTLAERVSARLGEATAGDMILRLVCDTLPVECLESDRAAESTPFTDALQQAVKRGAALHYVVPDESVSAVWESTYATGTSPGLSDHLSRWSRRSLDAPSSAPVPLLHRIGTAPVFTSGLDLVAVLRPDPSGGLAVLSITASWSGDIAAGDPVPHTLRHAVRRLAQALLASVPTPDPQTPSD